MIDLLKLTLRQARRLVVLVIGSTILVIAGVLILLPGPPGWPMIPLGLGILATEFLWARRLLMRIKEGALNVARKGLGNPNAEETSETSDPAACEA